MRLYLSDEAFNGLVEQAKAKAKGTDIAYIRGEQRARGLSYFMVALLDANPTPNLWLDRRPDYARQDELAKLESGQFPQWDDGLPRYARPLGLRPEFLVRCGNLAKALGVIKSNEPHQKGRGDRLAPLALSSQFWEAVGTGWLKPTNVPVPMYKTKHREQKEEMVW